MATRAGSKTEVVSARVTRADRDRLAKTGAGSVTVALRKAINTWLKQEEPARTKKSESQ